MDNYSPSSFLCILCDLQWRWLLMRGASNLGDRKPDIIVDAFARPFCPFHCDFQHDCSTFPIDVAQMPILFYGSTEARDARVILPPNLH